VNYFYHFKEGKVSELWLLADLDFDYKATAESCAVATLPLLVAFRCAWYAPGGRQDSFPPYERLPPFSCA
jgi:hypothetical protein